MELKSKPASELTAAQLAAIFSLSFSNYVTGPISFTADALDHHLKTDHIDIDRSHVFYDAAAPDEDLAFGLIATRDDRPQDARLGAFGVVPAAQGKGVGKKAVEIIVNAEKERGTRILELEVIKSNDAAVRLYDRTGFSRVRELYAWEMLAGDEYPPECQEDSGLQTCTVDEVSRLVKQSDEASELSYQGYLFADSDKSQLGLRLDHAYCVISDPEDEEKDTIYVITLFVEPEFRGQGQARRLTRAVQARYKHKGKKWLVNGWYDRSVGERLALGAGFKKHELSQYLLRRDLTST